MKIRVPLGGSYEQLAKSRGPKRVERSGVGSATPAAAPDHCFSFNATPDPRTDKGELEKRPGTEGKFPDGEHLGNYGSREQTGLVDSVAGLGMRSRSTRPWSNSAQPKDGIIQLRIMFNYYE